MIQKGKTRKKWLEVANVRAAKGDDAGEWANPFITGPNCSKANQIDRKMAEMAKNVCWDKILLEMVQKLNIITLRMTYGLTWPDLGHK